MLQLAELIGDGGAVYRAYARGILGRLSEPEFLGSAGAAWEGILKQSLYHRGNGMGVDESVMWGDYYFVEALDKLARVDAETAHVATHIAGAASQ